MWCEEDEFAYYDYKLIRRVLQNLRNFRKNDNVEELKGVLEACVKANFGRSVLVSSSYFVRRHRKSSTLQSNILRYETLG